MNVQHAATVKDTCSEEEAQTRSSSSHISEQQT